MRLTQRRIPGVPRVTHKAPSAAAQSSAAKPAATPEPRADRPAASGAGRDLPPQGATAEPEKPKDDWFEIVKTVASALLIALVLRTVLFQPFTIPSASMEPTLFQGDYIIVSKWTYGYSKYSLSFGNFSLPLPHGRLFGRSPNRGDIVVFKLPRNNKTDYIKLVPSRPTLLNYGV